MILSWDSSAENSEDYLTGYYDFEGYRLYKSTMVEIPGELIAIKFMMIPAHLQAGSHSGNGIILKAKMNLMQFSAGFALKIIGD